MEKRHFDLPTHVAICGYPKHGKDEIANVLAGHFGYQFVDDGEVLRTIAPQIFNFPAEWCFSQEGKAQLVETHLGPRTVRDILGSLGNALEAQFGEHIIPFIAVNSVKGRIGRFVYPSVRKTQNGYYRNLGGFVIEVQRPGTPSSPYDFDRWDETAVNAVIVNDGDLSDLRRAIYALMERLKDDWPENRMVFSAKQSRVLA